MDLSRRYYKRNVKGKRKSERKPARGNKDKSALLVFKSRVGTKGQADKRMTQPSIWINVFQDTFNVNFYLETKWFQIQS